MTLIVRVGALWNRDAYQFGHLALVVSVTDSDGKPVSGLSEQNFAVYVFDRLAGGNIPMTSSKAAPPSDFQVATEPEGVYGMVTADAPEPPQGSGQWGATSL